MITFYKGVAVWHNIQNTSMENKKFKKKEIKKMENENIIFLSLKHKYIFVYKKWDNKKVWSL